VEHSIMKRAWPYAVALAVVVTGCYLALTPLLRSLSPGATTSTSSISKIQTTITVGQAKGTTIILSPNAGQQRFVSNIPETTKKTTKKTVKKTVKSSPPSTTDTTGFATGSPSSSSQTTKTPTVKAKTKTVKRGTGSVNGAVDPANGGGLASSGGGDSTGTGGTHSDPAGN
jgi:hypothetical protein